MKAAPDGLLLSLPDPIWRLTLQLAYSGREGGLARLLGELVEARLGDSSDPENASAHHQAPVS